MERTQAIGKDVIIHRDMTFEERERELQKLKEECNQLDEWVEENDYLYENGYLDNKKISCQSFVKVSV